MKLRSASLLDLSRIEQIHRESEARFSTTAPPARLWGMVSQTLSALLPLSQETFLFVAEIDGKVAGFVQASPRQPRQSGLSLPAKATSLQVLNLCVANGVDEAEVAPSLVDYLCEQAGRHGVTQLFVRVPLDEPLLAVFRMGGFRQYATESLLFAEHPKRRSSGVPFGLRPSRGRDSRLLYHLYRQVTPLGVAQLEAPSYKAWRAQQHGGGQQEIIDRVEVAGWLRVQKSSSEGRPHTLDFVALPDLDVAGELADRALTLSEGGPAWSSLRHYDSHMIDALRGRGFSQLLTQALLVREVAVREALRDKLLVPSFG
jgi:hypothetical protein